VNIVIQIKELKGVWGNRLGPGAEVFTREWRKMHGGEL
jgi:hypothetical protein